MNFAPMLKLLAIKYGWTAETVGRLTPTQTAVYVEETAGERPKPFIEHMSVEEARRRGVIK